MTVAGTLPEARTVTATGNDPVGDWTITIRSDFSAALLEELVSGSVVRVLRAADPLVVSHNLPDQTGAVAASLMDVVPVDLCASLVDRAIGEISKLPNR